MIKKQRGEYLMKKYFLISIAVLAALSLLLSGVSFAQGKRGGGGWGPGTSYSRLYDPKTVENLSGEIDKIEAFTPRKGMRPRNPSVP